MTYPREAAPGPEDLPKTPKMLPVRLRTPYIDRQCEGDRPQLRMVREPSHADAVSGIVAARLYYQFCILNLHCIGLYILTGRSLGSLAQYSAARAIFLSVSFVSVASLLKLLLLPKTERTSFSNVCLGVPSTVEHQAEASFPGRLQSAGQLDRNYPGKTY